MGDHINLLLRFYYRPVKAASDLIDRGSFGFAVCCLVAALATWWFGPVNRAASQIGVSTLIAVFVVLVPSSVAVVAMWDSLGSVSVVLRNEYFSVLICAMVAWSAAYLPLGLLRGIIATAFGAPGLFLLAATALIGFLALYTICLRTALGTTIVHAVVATLVGCAAAASALALWPIVGNLSYFLLSPWVLYLLYRHYSPDVRSLSDSLTSRQNFRRQLETSMLNPRDADAHFQLGLIYQQRRQYDEAAASYKRALAIRPDEADAHLQLGRVLRAKGSSEEALRHFESALRLDPTVGRHEGWRELGAVLFDLERAEDARPALERYTNQRSYDPEGLYYYGAVLSRLGRTEEARGAFEQTLEAVQTAPPYRRGQLRIWASRAKDHLKSQR